MINDDIIYTPQVNDTQVNMRLDKYLSQCFESYSRSRIQSFIVQGCVMLDDMVLSDNSYKVKKGDSFQISVPQVVEAEPVAENIPLDIVYEDDDLIVVNKKAGMTVHIGAGAYSGTLVNALLHHCQNSLSGIGGVKRPGIVHRIDKDTSGLLVVAKNDVAHNFLSTQFTEHSIERTYYAVVYGILSPHNGRIEGNIARSNFDRKKMALVQTGGKYAATNYKTLEMFGNVASLIQCNLETGRTHQIRVHMSSKGNNLIGDKLYEKSKKSTIVAPSEIKKYINEFPRQALHAASLGFIHPKSKEFINFSVPLPQDMQELISCLRKI